MTDAPERIWVTGWFLDPTRRWWHDKPLGENTATTEYIRADLSPSPEVVKELVEALRLIADEAYVTVKANDKGIDHKHLYEGWRKIATTRIDVARAILAKMEGGE